MRFSSPIAFSGRLHFLDALRGLAAVGVMLFHFYAKGVSPIHTELAASLPTWLGRIIGQMYCGVNIFFVLSGFVIAFSMDGNVANWRYAGNFIARRSLRLDPPYWVTAALMLGYFFCVMPTKWHDYYLMYGGIPGVIANLLYLQNLPYVFPARSILEVSWTLCLEVQFYLAYLLILLTAHYASGRMGRHRAVIGRAIVITAVAAIVTWSFVSSVIKPSSVFQGQAWNFFLGVAVYGALTRGAPKIAVISLLAALGLLFAWNHQIDGLVTVVTATVIFTAGITESLSTLLAYRPLLYLGKISYSIYLMHMVIGANLLALVSESQYGDSLTIAWAAWALAIALSLIGAEVLHRTVEAPSNRLSQRLKNWRPAARCPAPQLSLDTPAIHP